MSADGSNPLVLTTDPGSEGSPSWSPDGLYLAFQTDRAGIGEIDIMNLNGEIIKKISLAAQDASEPVWKP
jgi:TolB protein